MDLSVMTTQEPSNSSPPPVPNRGHLVTEQRLTEAAAIDAMEVEQLLRLINTQDATVPTVVRHAIPKIAALVRAVVANVEQGGRIIYVGAGTSGRLGVLDASECPPTFFVDPGMVVGIIAGGDTALRNSSEGKEDDAAGTHAALDELRLTEHDTVIGIMAGGTTPYVWGALRYANEHRAVAALITCVKLSTLLPRRRSRLLTAKEQAAPPEKPKLPADVDHIIELVVGPEIVTGSTRLKAGTATKLALNMITTSVMIQSGKTWGNLMVDVRARSTKLRDRAARILEAQCDLSRSDALDLLDVADGQVKIALVIAKRGVDMERAKQLLDEHRGKLRPIIGAPR
jgi:N-acetylmuramic acid 6-phosphate etherase